ncbi:MAG: hypothetical protein LC790_04600 [Actinobacteria bacterium]|nr:hypothetical protein [Actinomycetota bacterium]
MLRLLRWRNTKEAKVKYMIGDQAHPTKTGEVSAALDEAHVIVWSSQIDDGETVFMFGSDSDFRAWASSAPSPIPEDTKKTEELVRKARELEDADNTAAMSSQDLAAERALADMDSLATRFDLTRT